MSIELEAARGAVGESEKQRSTPQGREVERVRLRAQLEYAQEIGNADMMDEYAAQLAALTEK